jgi:hypothetical protein
MIRRTVGPALAAVLAISASGCSSSPDPDIEPADIAAEPMQPVAPPAAALPTGNLSAGQIAAALSEKTFTYAAPGRSGTVTYYGDGTFSYQETGKGAGTGIWQASDGRLCEAYNPTSFLPRGTPSTCLPLASDGASFTAGQMVLRPG